MDTLLPDAPNTYRMLSVDWGLRNMAVVGFELFHEERELHVFLSAPFSVLGDVSGECAQTHPAWCGAMVSNGVVSALKEYQDPSSPFWMFQHHTWQVDNPISELVIEAANPPRPDNYAIVAALATALHREWPRASIHQEVRRQDVMRYFGIAVGGGREASKHGSRQAVERLLSNDKVRITGWYQNAKELLQSDHVCDALLQGLYVWREHYSSIIVNAPAVTTAFRPSPLHRHVLSRV